MAEAKTYKNRRSGRSAVSYTDYSRGMMFSENNVDEGFAKVLVNFDFENDNKVLTPRAGLRTKELILPDFTDYSNQEHDFVDDNNAIQAAKDCVENGKEFRQIVIGGLSEESHNEGKIWFTTTDKNYNTVVVDDTMDIDVNVTKLATASKRCTFFEAELPQIHNIKLTQNRKVSSVIGTFGFLNSFYFFGIDTETQGGLVFDKRHLYRSYYKDDPDVLRYVPEKVDILQLKASEAVNYGYNMLDENPYVFDDSIGDSSTFQMEGILPYDRAFGGTDEPKLLMTPKSNTHIWFRCNYIVPSNSKYDVVWSWKELSSDTWTEFHKETITIDANTTEPPVLQADLNAPTVEIMVRCEAYKYETATVSDAVEKAMTVGFDFTVNENNSSSNMEQEIYDLTTANGMCCYKNRLAVYGLPKDPTILFFSDYNEPGYFPYPNNIVTFDEPIIYAVNYLDSLVVFTTDKIYKVSLDDDGITWTSEVLQSNLYIEPYDRHLVKVIRNMLYFKSGNYYYMIVPKALSTTGELTLAPITTPITSFFEHFSANVSKVLYDTFHRNDTYDLVTYFNFLDYEFVHNMYVFSWDSDDTFIHFDIMYNTNARYWKICVYENPAILFPYKNDTTQYGLLASTSVNQFYNPEGYGLNKEGRIVQVFKFDKLNPKDFFIPSTASLTYYPDFVKPSSTIGKLTFSALASVVNSVLHLDKAIVSLPVKDKKLVLTGGSSYVKGFKITDIVGIFHNVINNYDNYFTFRNYQFLDTGYVSSEYVYNKRYREMQMQLANHSNNDLVFHYDFLIAGENRKIVYKYEVNQIIDETNPEYGIAYIDSVPYFEIDADEIDLSNAFTIKNDLFSNIDYWKLRANISGKGVAPRLRLNSRNEVMFQLLSINWVYRLMNMR